QDAGRAVGGDARAPSERRRRPTPTARSVRSRRDAEPDRVRRHLPAARSAARPVPREDRRRLSQRGRRGGRAPARAPRCRTRHAPRRAGGHVAGGDRGGALVVPVRVALAAAVLLAVVTVVDMLLARRRPRVRRSVAGTLARGVPAPLVLETVGDESPTAGRVELRQPRPPDFTIEPNTGW